MAAYGNLQPIIWNEQERRCTVFQIFCIKDNTISNTQVSELLGIDRRRDAELRQQLKDTRDPRLQALQQRPQARTPDFIRRVSDIFEHDPNRSIKDVAKELNVSHVTLLACVNEDLRCHNHKLKRHTNRLAHNTKDALINSIVKQARKLDRVLVAKACFSFRARIQCVIDAEGG
ncbi:Uncharacterized protein FKW44_004355 [Caligus rogercresseyi]|uniref:Uncharacterized protein n=1 Tax=Caligus rogercresseyi TaxID=217165 RepID=A0A7T8HLG4_CALRO|nr:Uncharacterized protein FKW44_004355 [Caligus rogercresseyi]